MKNHVMRLVWITALAIMLVGCKADEASEEPVDQPKAAEDTANTPVDPKEDTATAVPVKEPSPLRAITPTEYNNTIRDLLGMPNKAADWPAAPAVAAELTPPEGVKAGLFGAAPVKQSPWPWSFPEEMGVNHFEGMAKGQEPSPYSVEQLQKAAMKYAPYALVSPTFFTCDDWMTLDNEAQNACGKNSVEAFAQRAWRRPLSDLELTRLNAFWDTNWDSGTPEQAVALTVAGILQAPAFVFHMEYGDDAPLAEEETPLSGWEMASRLSYFLWDSLPDQALWDAAQAGELASVEGIETQVRRMLTDDRARSAVVHFHHQWLGTNKVRLVSPARRAYGSLYGLAPTPPLDTTGDGQWPAVLTPVRHSMEAETHLFVERTIFDGAGTFKALMTDNHGYMSAVTQPLYGDTATVLPGTPVTWAYGLTVNSQGNNQEIKLYPTEFAPEERAGVLTLPSVLALGAYAVHPAPIIRGKMVLERLACQKFGAPPPGAEASVPPDKLDVKSTNRERTETATSPQVCADCHQTLNPPGFAFENYDAMGRYRTTDNGLPVDASGEVTLWGEEKYTFSDGVDLAHQLAASPRVQDCYVYHWTRYATGRDLVWGNTDIVALQEKFRGFDNIQELLVSITTSALFRYRSNGGQP